MSNNDLANNNNTNGNQNPAVDIEENSGIEYPSGELLLSVVQKEYDYETARKTALETRAGILLTLAAAILTFTFSNVKIPKITSPINDYSTLIFYVSNFLVGVLSVISIIVSLNYLLKVIFIREYKRLETSSLNGENAKFQPNAVALALTLQYHEIIENNHKVNHDKTELYRKGTNWLIVSLFSSVVLYGIAMKL